MYWFINTAMIIAILILTIISFKKHIIPSFVDIWNNHNKIVENQQKIINHKEFCESFELNTVSELPAKCLRYYK